MRTADPTTGRGTRAAGTAAPRGSAAGSRRDALDVRAVVAEPGLPGLALLLDDAALTAVLRHHGWLSPGERARVDRVRLKPGTRAQAALRVEPTGSWLLAGTYAPAGWDKAGKDPAAARRLGRSALVLPAERLVVVPNAADRDVPALGDIRPDDRAGVRRGRALDSLAIGVDRIRRGTAGRAAVAGPGLVAATLAHNPARRWVGSLRRAGGAGAPLAFLKAYADPAAPGRAAVAARALASVGVPTPACVTCAPGLLAADWTPGRPADPTSAGDAAATADLVRRVAAVTESPSSAAALPRVGVGEILRAAHAAAHAVSPLLPDAPARLRRLLAALDRRLAAWDAAPVGVHGDLSSDQVVLGPGGAVLVDLDRAALGPPGWDGASWLAAQVAAGAGLAGVAELPGEAPPGPLVAAAAVLRAPEPWRRRRAGRAAATARLLDLAEAAIGGAGRSPRGRR